ncbi:outer membrane beta-barrel protein [Candidatus Zixiibacteriota bacterium]
MSRRIVLLLAITFPLVFSSIAQAGFGVGGNLLISLPQEDFANVSETGGGLGLNFLYSPPMMPVIAIRVDVGLVAYGSEIYEDEVAGIPVDVKYSNQSAQVTIGPQFQMPTGPVRFYAAPMVGVYNYTNTVSIEGTDISETESSTTNFGWNFSSGMLVRVYQSPIKKFNLDIDLSGKYHTIKDAIETEIEDDVVIKTDANDISIHAGVLFTF